MVKKIIVVLVMLVITVISTSCTVIHPQNIKQTQIFVAHSWESQDPYIFISKNNSGEYYDNPISKMEINGEIVDVEIYDNGGPFCNFIITEYKIVMNGDIMRGDYKIVGDTLILYNIESYVGDQFGDEIVLKKVE